jgi:UDP-glucose 4-epimerase
MDGHSATPLRTRLIEIVEQLFAPFRSPHPRPCVARRLQRAEHLLTHAVPGLSPSSVPPIDRLRTGSRFLVTGGCGFIGSHLADRLVALGRHVRILDDLSTGRLGNAPAAAELVIGDVADEPTVRRALHEVDGCFHLAAAASVVRCNAQPLATNRTNLAGTLNVLTAAAKRAVPVVYASSAAVYGANPAVPLVETSATQPLSVYAADKLACELHAGATSHLYGVPTVGLRLFNVYGPRQDPSSPYCGVISIFASRIRNRQELLVFGDGKQTRDFIFVDDVVAAFIAAMAERQPGASTCNVCTGKGTTILALAELLAELAGAPALINYAAPRAGDVHVSVGDPGRLADRFGVVAATSLREGLIRLLHDDAPPASVLRRTAEAAVVDRR